MSVYKKGKLVSQINRNVQKRFNDIGNDFLREANDIAPIQYGNLRASGRVESKTNGCRVIWGNQSVKYADIRYKSNNKNPYTTFWGKKALVLRKGVYERWLSET